MRKRIKSPVAYMGGKHKLGRKIAEQLPESQLYVEPFCGMASVFLAREPISKTNILSDIEGRVVHFLRMMRDEPERLGDWLAKTPWSRAEFEASLKQDHPDPVVRAAQTAIVCIMSMLSTPKPQPHRNFGMHTKHQRNLTHLKPEIETAGKKLLRAQLETDPALKLIRRVAKIEDAVIYCDPPYLARASRHYADNMTENEHRELLELLLTCKGKVAISGYPSALYAELLKGWRSVSWEQKLAMSPLGSSRQDTLWMNY